MNHYNFYLKSRKVNILSESNYFNLFSIDYFKNFSKKIKNKLFNLNYPYKISFKKYMFSKLIFAPIIFVVALINYKSFFMPFVLFLIVFFICDYLIYLYKKKEASILIVELKSVTLNLILGLSTYAPFKTVLKAANDAITYPRFKEAFSNFIKTYEANGYELNKALLMLENKFYSYELTVFTSLIRQGEKEGSLVENLERFVSTLDLNYFKYLKRQTAKRLLYVTFGTVLSLLNIILIIMYPIVIKVMTNLEVIFS